jgi:hypothetical protein
MCMSEWCIEMKVITQYMLISHAECDVYFVQGNK